MRTALQCSMVTGHLAQRATPDLSWRTMDPGGPTPNRGDLAYSVATTFSYAKALMSRLGPKNDEPPVRLPAVCGDAMRTVE